MNNEIKKETTKTKSTADKWFRRALGLLFIVLKVLGLIKWPWILVLTPFWIMPLLFVLMAGAVLLGAFAIAIFSSDEK